MQTIAYVGLVASLVGTVAAWRLIGRFESAVGESLEVTGDTLVTLEETVTVAEGVVVSVDEALVAAEGTMTSLVDTVAGSSDVVADVENLVSTVAPSLERTVTTLDEVATAGRAVDAVLEQLSRVPFGPDYSPEESLGDQLAQLSDDLEPVVAALSRSSSSFSELQESTDDLTVSLRSFAAAVSTVNDDLDESERLLAGYRSSTERAAILIEQVRADLADDARVTRLLVVIVGLTIAVGQIVPFWVGKELVARSEQPLRAIGERDDDFSPLPMIV